MKTKIEIIKKNWKGILAKDLQYSLTGIFYMIKIHAWNMRSTPASGYHHFCWIFKWVSTCMCLQFNVDSEI